MHADTTRITSPDDMARVMARSVYDDLLDDAAKATAAALERIADLANPKPYTRASWAKAHRMTQDEVGEHVVIKRRRLAEAFEAVKAGYEPEEVWRFGAACIGLTDMFFPDGNSGANPYSVARRICDQCPVVRDCLIDGLREPAGMWGGLIPRERQNLLRRTK